MELILPVVAAVLIVVLIIVMLVHFQNQQIRQLQAIYDRLIAMKAPPPPRPDPADLRRERAERIGRLMMLEADLAKTGRQPTEEELGSVDAARASVRSVNDRLKLDDEWRGPPYDLEWVDFLERLPEIRRCLLAAEAREPGSAISAGS